MTIVLNTLATALPPWLVTGTKFGFLDYRGKRVMDRIMPMLKPPYKRDIL